MLRYALLTACGVLLSAPANAGVEDSASRFSAAEREAFRQDLENIQQRFYQASPESRRRWIESVRQQRQLLDQQEDQISSTQRRSRRSATEEQTGVNVSRAAVRPIRERVSDPSASQPPVP